MYGESWLACRSLFTRQEIMGTYGTTADWIELCNSSDETISLSKYSIYDRGSDPGRFVLPDVKLKPGRLADLAPTMLDIMSLEIPAEMTGESLIEK